MERSDKKRIRWGTRLLLICADGVQATSAEDGVLFDLTGDGIIFYISSTEAGSDDAWSAMDRDGDWSH